MPTLDPASTWHDPQAVEQTSVVGVTVQYQPIPFPTMTPVDEDERAVSPVDRSEQGGRGCGGSLCDHWPGPAEPQCRRGGIWRQSSLYMRCGSRRQSGEGAG